uniref:Acyltransferase n=1 Tax=Rhizochromulina marina TaxID=1034831 RepID=A0A7S2WNH2_9STRA|mmetsp:Transcript_28583/g.83657  ORF Transcript_28583/g.83657 Transcript_28583/m.83657 type:complete len:319 (+) Transcript_28583:9-965(+)
MGDDGARRKRPALAMAAGLVACCVWVQTWLVVPFLVPCVCLWWAGRSRGVGAAVLIWVGLGHLCPQLSASESVRAFLRTMRDWIGSEVVRDEISVASVDSMPKPLLQCHHPHGVAAINSISCPIAPRSAAVAPAVLMIPFCRQMMELCGAVSSSRQAMKDVMRGRKDLALIPGGVEEVVLASPRKERVFIKNRKGFIKYCIQFGYDVRAVYHFGETQLYDVMFPWDEPWAVKWRLWLARTFQLATGLGVGCRYWPLAPKPNIRCISVEGPRIELPCVPEPPRDLVEKYHAVYVESLQKLYAKHRHRHASYASKELEIW